MLALCGVHMMNYQVTPKMFFRAVYMWKFNKDISDLALANDITSYLLNGKVPPYVVDYLTHIYGTQ
jgi:hypothetical protein